MFKTIALSFFLNVIALGIVCLLLLGFWFIVTFLAPLSGMPALRTVAPAVGWLLMVHTLHAFITAPLLYTIINRRDPSQWQGALISLLIHYLIGALFCAIIYAFSTSQNALRVLRYSAIALLVIAPIIGASIISRTAQ